MIGLCKTVVKEYIMMFNVAYSLKIVIAKG